MRASSAQATLQLEQVGWESPEYAFIVSMQLPGGIYPDASPAVTDVHVEAATTTDVPDGSRIDEGFPTRLAKVTLAGSLDPSDETKTVSWLFGRYSTTSPLYQQDAFRSLVTIDVAVYPQGAGGTSELFRQFTGYVDDYSENPDGSVEFDLKDFRADLRNVASLPAVVTTPPFNAGLTAEYAVDAVVRDATSGAVSSWPAQRPGCVLAVGMRSSVWPEVGTLIPLSYSGILFGRGVFGTAATPANLAYTFPNPLTDDFTTDFWLSTTDGSTPGPVTIYINSQAYPGTVDSAAIDIGTTYLNVSVSNGPGGGGATASLTIPAAPVRYIGVQVHWPVGSTTATITVRVNGTTYTPAPLTLPAARHSPWTDVQASGYVPNLIEGWQVSNEASPTWRDTFTPQAVLDPSLTPLQVVPEITGDPWQTIQEICAAELAVAGFDEYGVFRFVNRRTIAAAPVARSITSAKSLKSLTVQNSTASVINRAQVGWTAWTTAATRSWVYSAASVIKVPRGGSKTITTDLDGYATNLDTGVGVYANGASATTASAYRASTDSVGTKEHPGLSFAVTQPNGANKLTVVITNSTGLDAYLVSPANYTDIAVGTPFFNIAGQVVTQQPEATADNQWPPASHVWPSGLTGAAGSRFGEVAWQLSGNQWIQDEGTAQQLSVEVSSLSAVPLPDLGEVDVVFDPRLQLIDVVHLLDPDVSNVDEYCRVFGLALDYQAGDGSSSPTMTQTIDARTLAAPGGWILGVPGRTEVGTGSGTADSTAYVYAAN